MGKGDRRSKKGKICKGTFGKYRSAKDGKNTSLQAAQKLATQKAE